MFRSTPTLATLAFLRIFNWLICESYDDKGNAMVYAYAIEDSNGVNLCKHMAMRCSRSPPVMGGVTPVLIRCSLKTTEKSRSEH